MNVFQMNTKCFNANFKKQKSKFMAPIKTIKLKQVPKCINVT
jgi:hypothetical protein